MQAYCIFLPIYLVLQIFCSTFVPKLVCAMKIAFTTQLPEEGFRRLFSKDQGDSRWERGEYPEADVLVSTFDVRVPREMIAGMPHLKLIANFGAGYNNIDLEACRERGIRVTNTPLPVVEPTAELAFALMIDVARRVSEFDRMLREKYRGLSHGVQDAPPQVFGVMNNLSHSLYGKTLGIIGMGRIGRALARRAIACGMRIIYHNRHEISRERLNELTKEQNRVQYVDLQTLLQDSDFVSLNLPYTPEVHHLIGKPELGMMKRSAYLINTARGAHVDEEALVEALRSGIIAGAAMDVYEHEPAIHPGLLQLDNVVLSPHTGTGTWEGRIAMCENVVDNIIAFAEGRTDAMDSII